MFSIYSQTTQMSPSSDLGCCPYEITRSVENAGLMEISWFVIATSCTLVIEL